MTEQTNRSAAYQAASPHPDLKSLEQLVGMWNLSGDTQGQITYEWMEGGFFLLQKDQRSTIKEKENKNGTYEDRAKV